MALWEIIAFCTFLGVILVCFVLLTIEERKRYQAFTLRELTQAQLNQKLLLILESEWSDLDADLVEHKQSFSRDWFYPDAEPEESGDE